MSKENKYFEGIKLKDFIHNKDINQHIINESLRMMDKIENTVIILKDILNRRDKELRDLNMENFLLKGEKLILEINKDIEIYIKDIEINRLNYVISEQNKLIETLLGVYVFDDNIN